VKVVVDRDTCAGCELCVDSCPEVFEMFEDLARAKAEVVPEGQEDCVKEAAEDCPVEAISVEE